MDTPTNRDMRHPWRRRLFGTWIVATAVIALYIGIGGPLANYFGDGRAYFAIASTALMFFLLVTGFGWLILFVLAGPPRHPRVTKSSDASADIHNKS